jgi:hypothetical protein
LARTVAARRADLVVRLLVDAPAVKSGSPRRPTRALAILRHYVEHPGTADTLEGLAGWRLLEDFVQQRVMDTERALQWLVRQRYLEKIGGTAITPDLYRLNPGKRLEAERLIRARRSTPRRSRR